MLLCVCQKCQLPSVEPKPFDIWMIPVIEVRQLKEPWLQLYEDPHKAKIQEIEKTRY